MAQYKVPQDVEADDKLLGPFSFRQFVYLLIAGGLIALGVALFQIFPLLALIPLPFVLFLGALALPLKKDQPMETYLAALVSYYLKPRTRMWMPGQKNTIVTVTAPKVVEESRTRDITGEEATHRLSFLAGIVDTQGYAIKGLSSNTLRDDLIAESNATNDIFETGHFDNLAETINKDEIERHENVIKEMKEEIAKVEGGEVGGETRQDADGDITGWRDGSKVATSGAVVGTDDKTTMESGTVGATTAEIDAMSGMTVVRGVPSSRVGATQGSIGGPNFDSSVVVKPEVSSEDDDVKNSAEEIRKKMETMKTKPSIIELANNAVFSVETIAKEANRIKERDEGEVFISLH